MSILVKNCMLFWREYSNAVKISPKNLTFKKISPLQPHILNHIVTWFADRGWPLRILRCTDVELAKAPEDRIFPVFAIVATKFRKMNNATPILEISLSRY